MNEEKRLTLLNQLENPNLTYKEKAKIEYQLFELDNHPQYGLMILFGSIIVFLLIFTIVLTSK
ncbi:hypothetical protein D3C75_259060 [compost metagenome]